jgi:malonyl-CoA O-methyltransferase
MADPHVDKHWVRASFDRAATTYEGSALLQKEVGERMLGRLDYVRLQPEVILDIGCGTGTGLQGLKKRYGKSRVIGMDFAENMLRQARKKSRFSWNRPSLVAGDMEALPLAPASVDLVYSNLTLQWCADLEQVFAGIISSLRSEGLFFFSTLGPDTLREIRASWAEVNDYPHVIHFPDMHDVGDALVNAGFADVVMDVERITMRYDTPREAIESLRAIGAVNRDTARSRGLVGSGQWKRMLQSYEQFRLEDGRYPITYEVVFGHALRPGNVSADRDGVARIPLSAIKPSK